MRSIEKKCLGSVRLHGVPALLAAIKKGWWD